MSAYILDSNLQANTPVNLPPVNRPKYPPPLMGGHMDRNQPNIPNPVLDAELEQASKENKNIKFNNHHSSRNIRKVYE